METETSEVCTERSREIVYSKLMMKKADATEFTQQLLVARYGLPPQNQQETSPCAEIGVFKGSHNHKKLSQSPLFNIPLKGASMEEDSASTGNGKPTRESKKLNKHSFQFGIKAVDGVVYKFRVRDEREHRTWTNLIKFLAMFPHSVVPGIPSYDPPTIMSNLVPTLCYKADSVWPVFVLPEEVGFRCRLEGPKILVLENQNEMNKLEIYSEQEQSFPMFSCKHSEIRRIGKMGIFLYVEVGRRCRAGPGLLWLYFGNNNDKAMYMREVLCQFLLNKEPVHHQCTSQSPTRTSRMKRSSTAPMLADLSGSSQRQLPPQPLPGSFGSPRHSLSPTLPPSPLLKLVQSTAVSPTRKHSGSDVTVVADKAMSQGHLCNSYHTLEPLQDTDNGPQYHVLDPFQETSQITRSLELPQSRQAPLYHVLERHQDAGQTPATYHVLEPPQVKSTDFPHHGMESPKRIMPPSPYYVTDLQSRSGQMSPQWSLPSPSHRLPSSPSLVVTQTEPGMDLEPLSAAKQSSYHVLESPPRTRRHFSEKPRRHKLNTSRSQDSYHELEPPALQNDPQQPIYHEIEPLTKPRFESSRSVIVRSDRHHTTGVFNLQQQQQHKYNALKSRSQDSDPGQPLHYYDAIDPRMSRKHLEENHHHQYHMLGLKEEPKAMSTSPVPMYHTIANK